MRAIRRLILVLVALAAAGYAYAWRSSIAPIQPPPPAAFPAEAIRAGASLAAIGNCATCHTRDGGPSNAGGRPIETPFGTIHSTNITPDPATGIGAWSQAAFARAVREGVSRDGRHLYPAFPYDHMARTTDADIRAVYAYLMTRRPVAAPARANDLAFPYSMRPLIAGWKLLFMSSAGFTPDPSKSAEWNRGAYLVEGLAHCGSCHTPRNRFGAEDKSRAYAGADIDGWRAPALGPASPAAVPWTAARLAEYLGKGRAPHHGSASGPMGPVIRNLAQVPEQDIAAMASYVASIAGVPSRDRQESATRILARAAGSAPPTRTPPSGPGAAIYQGACAQCHGEAGRAPREPALNLALSTSVRAGTPGNLVRIVLAGLRPAENEPGPQMPPFADVLTDAQLADLVRFVRQSFSQGAPFEGVENAVTSARRQIARTQQLSERR